MVNNTKKEVKIEIERKDGKTLFSFSVAPELESIFNKSKQEVRQSEAWDSLRFYYCPEITNSSAYNSLLTDFNLIDNFGSALYSGGHFNIAFLRTEGGKGQIVLPNSIPFAIVSEGVKNMIAFVKKYYADYLQDYKIKGVISLEI